MTESASVEMLAQKLDEHLSECGRKNLATAESFRQLKEGHQAIHDKIAEFERLPMRALRWIGGIVATAAIGIAVQNFVLHEQTIKSAEAAAVNADAAAHQSVAIAKAVGAPVTETPATEPAK